MGGGIVGMWTADVLSAMGHDVLLVSAVDHSSTTSAAAVCVLTPFFPGDPNSEVFQRELSWAARTLDHVKSLDPQRDRFLELTTCFEFGLDGMLEDGFPLEKLDHLDFADFTIHHLERTIANCNFAVQFDCHLCNTGIFLPWLRLRLEDQGVRIRIERIRSLERLGELASNCDVVFNCTGFGELFPDADLYPVSGQSMFIPDGSRADRHFGLGAGHHAIFRHQLGFYLGSFFMTNRLYGIPRQDLHDQSMLFASDDYPVLCESVGVAPPTIDLSRVERVNAGIRPFRRGGPRVEYERCGTLDVVHNYGHGAHGWTMGYASAQAAVDVALAKFEGR